MSLVYKLQNKIVSSFEGPPVSKFGLRRALAIRKIVTNSPCGALRSVAVGGAKTTGIDKILWTEQRFKAIEELGLITTNGDSLRGGAS
jgi:hypothetical protein